ncbi:hypothetical protein BJD20_16375 [Acinetobacter proteolyticus]|uniref:hypothetical protein n=1 Tax=Acinetobacter proteolyticus TaxID=1776741 RepID=UPI0008635653|nr:hypothetical protein [Acinetobacter proteolyticus]OEY94970.1 hypothetical protein BJD20_16375 [Acinetobacter proteolyticus]
MKKVITGVLLAITSTYALASPTGMSKEELKKYYAQFEGRKTPKGEENKFYIKYDVSNKKILEAYSLDMDIKKQERCADRLFSGKEAKKLELMAKGKTGKINLIYYCSR